jgi:zinc protease
MKIINHRLIEIAFVCAFLVVSQSLFALVKSPPEKAILPNGMKIIVVEDNSLPVVAAGLIFNARPFYLANCNSGLGRIYRSIMETADFKNETRFDFNARLEKAGIITEFGGGQDMFYVACNGNNDSLDLILASLRSFGFSLKPSVDNFARAKDEVLRQVKTALKFPLSSGLMERMAWKDLFPRLAIECHSPVDSSQLEKSQFADLESFVNSVFVPNNAVLVVVGDISASTIFTGAMKEFGDLNAAEVNVDSPADIAETARSRKIENIDFLDIEDTEVLLAFEAPGYNDAEMPAAFLWQAVLHDVNNSWLEYTVRKDFPELKNLFARYIPGREKGIFVIGFSSKEADANRPINFILTSLANLAMDPPKGNELRRVVEMMQLKILEKRETRLERAFELGMSEIMGNFRIAEGLSSAYNRVTPEDLKRLAAKMFSSDRYSIRMFYPISMQRAEENPVKLKVLDNGAKIIVRSIAGCVIIGLSLVFGIDSCSANKDEQKLSRLVAEMICQSINDSDNSRLNRRLDEIGAKLEAHFSNETLVLSARTQKQNLPELLAFLKDVMQKPEFNEKFFVAAKQKILAKIEEDNNDSGVIIYNSLLDGLFPGLNQNANLLLPSDVESISLSQVENFYKNWAVASNLCVSAVGNFDSAKTLGMIESAFAGIAKGTGLVVSQCPDWAGQPLDKTTVKEISLPAKSEEAYIAVGFRMKQFLKFASPEDLQTSFGANSVLNHLLVSSSNALIAQELKKIDALIRLNGGYTTSQQYSVFSIYAAVPVDKVEEARKAIEGVIARIPDMTISSDDIQASGRKLKSFFNRAMEKSEVQASVLGSFLQKGLKADFLEEIISVYGSITVENVKKGARENFNNYLMIIGKPAK